MKNLTLRLSDEMHARLKAEAEANRRSLHAEILWRLEHSSPTTSPADRPV